MHGHSMNAVLATLLDTALTEFRCTHLEMMKGIAGHGFYDNLVVPIIENTARECELTDRMRAAMLAYPRSNAVLVRRHGVYVWGKTWIEAKTQAECYDYLFGIAVRMHGMGIDAARAPARVHKALVNGQHANNGTTDTNGMACFGLLHRLVSTGLRLIRLFCRISNPKAVSSKGLTTTARCGCAGHRGHTDVPQLRDASALSVRQGAR